MDRTPLPVIKILSFKVCPPLCVFVVIVLVDFVDDSK